MNNLDFTFEESPLDLFPDIHSGSTLSAARFLTAAEEMPEDAVEEMLLELENRDIMLDISDLPKVAVAGEAALRLRREAELVKSNTLLTALEENDPLRLYLEELSSIPVCGDGQALALQCAAGNVAAQERLLNVS